VYRLVFEDDYAIAINSEVKSQMFLTHENHDIWESLRVNRVSGLSELVPAGR